MRNRSDSSDYPVDAIFLLSAELCARLNEWIVRQGSPLAAANRSFSIAIRAGQIQVRLPEKVSGWPAEPLVFG